MLEDCVYVDYPSFSCLKTRLAKEENSCLQFPYVSGTKPAYHRMKTERPPHLDRLCQSPESFNFQHRSWA